MSQLIISDSILSMFSRRADLIKEFPFLQIKTPPKAGCKCRQAPGEREAIAKEMERVKQTIANQPPDRLKRLKTIIGTQQMVLYYRGPKGVQKAVL